MQDLGNTQFFKVDVDTASSVKVIQETVFEVKKEKGYNPVNQIVGYIMSGDPTYITSYKNARSLIMKVDRDEIVEELLKNYISSNKWEQAGSAKRIMGLDFGSKTVGVAISDELLITAQGIEIIRRKEENKLRQTLARIEELIVEYNVTEIVLGYPKNMNDTLGERVHLTEEFKEKLERRTGLPVSLWDERLTTVAADRIMMEAGVRRENRKDYVDQIAATLILQGYLDLKGRQRENGESNLSEE